MSRGHFAYPLVRPIDDAGGAADLQTDIMRFMAILALCLLAIFALVQSLPPVPVAAAVEEPEVIEVAEVVEVPEVVQPEPAEPTPAALDRPTKPMLAKAPEPVALTRPKWQPATQPAPVAKPPPLPPSPADDKPGFTLRFESDLALSRLVATGQVGVFALSGGNAQRMSVAESRISFWAAPVPKQFHEMDRATVPRAVRDALERTGRSTPDTAWAVTLPARLSGELGQIMRQHRGGALVIAKDGSLRREPG